MNGVLMAALSDLDDESVGVVERWLETHLRRCGHCGRPFIPRARSDQTYCHRATAVNCATAGAQAAFARRMSPVEATYRRAYKKLHIRARRHGIDGQLVDQWREAAKALRDHAQHETWDEVRFTEGLEALAARLGLAKA